MTDVHDVYQEHSVEGLVDDPVATNANPIDRVLAVHRHAVRWPGVVGRQIKGRSDPLLLATLQRGERPLRPPRKPDLVRCGHDRPRSALTCLRARGERSEVDLDGMRAMLARASMLPMRSRHQEMAFGFYRTILRSHGWSADRLSDRSGTADAHGSPDRIHPGSHKTSLPGQRTSSQR